MNADGTGARRIPLTAAPSRSRGLFAPPVEKLRVSPDGRYVVYLANGRNLSGSTLVLVDLSNGKQRALTSAFEIMQPIWRSDSKSVRYMRMAPVPNTDPQWLSVHDVSLDGEDRSVRAFPLSQYPQATWLMDYNAVVNFRWGGYTLMRLDGSPDRVLLRGARIASPGDLSRDGSTLAIPPSPGGSEGASHKLLLFSLSDGRQRSLNLPFADYGCGPFSPDGQHLYCKGRETDSGPQTLYEVPIDGSKPRVVASSNSREIRGANELSPDGKWMLETVTGVRRTAFVSLDYSDGMTRLLRSADRP